MTKLVCLLNMISYTIRTVSSPQLSGHFTKAKPLFDFVRLQVLPFKERERGVAQISLAGVGAPCARVFLGLIGVS
jgi:hypothetical protein